MDKPNTGKVSTETFWNLPEAFGLLDTTFRVFGHNLSSIWTQPFEYLDKCITVFGHILVSYIIFLTYFWTSFGPVSATFRSVKYEISLRYRTVSSNFNIGSAGQPIILVYTPFCFVFQCGFFRIHLFLKY